jgi:hypothetical protein
LMSLCFFASAASILRNSLPRIDTISGGEILSQMEGLSLFRREPRDLLFPSYMFDAHVSFRHEQQSVS